MQITYVHTCNPAISHLVSIPGKVGIHSGTCYKEVCCITVYVDKVGGNLRIHYLKREISRGDVQLTVYSTAILIIETVK